MKQLYNAAKAVHILSVFFLLFADKAWAQPSQINQSAPLPGGPVNTVLNITFGGVHATITPKYIGFNGPCSSSFGNFSYSKITITAAKKCTTDDNKLLVLFGNQVMAYEYNPATCKDTAYFVGTIGTPGSESFDDIDGDAIYVQSSAYLRVSHDHGATWVVDSTGLLGAHVNAMYTHPNATPVYIATTNGIFKQDTTVTSWTQVTGYTGSPNLGAIFVDRTGRILVGTGSYNEGVFLSTTGGTSWAIDSIGLGAILTSGAWVVRFSDDVYGNLYAITKDFSNNTKLYQSLLGTGPWVEIDAPIKAQCVNPVTFNCLLGDSALIAGTSFGKFISTDLGVTWAMDTAGVWADHLFALVKTSTGRLVASAPLGIFTLDHSSAAWTQTYPVTGYRADLALYGDNAGNLFIQNPDLNNIGATSLMKSTDNGNTWATDTVGLSAMDGNVFYIDENNVQHYANSNYGSAFYTHMWSRSLSGSWVADTTNFPVQNYSYVSAICSDLNGYFYASGYLGGMQNTLRRPITGGAWAVDTAGTSVIGHFPYMTSGHQTIIGYSNSGIYMRQAAGWVSINLPSVLSVGYNSVSAVSIDGNGVVFAGFYDYNNYGTGVYYTKDSGATWTFAGLDSNYVNKMVSYGDTTYALTAFRQGYKLTATPDKESIRNIIAPGKNTKIVVNVYPNPFSNNTTINYQLPTDAFISVKIYDITGREIESLVNEQRVAGDHSVTFNMEGLPNGIYYCVVSAQDGKDYLETKTVRLSHLQ